MFFFFFYEEHAELRWRTDFTGRHFLTGLDPSVFLWHSVLSITHSSHGGRFAYLSAILGKRWICFMIQLPRSRSCPDEYAKRCNDWQLQVKQPISHSANAVKARKRELFISNDLRTSSSRAS